MALFLATALALVGLGAAQPTSGCPANIPRDEYLTVFDGVCYQFVPYAYPFSDADSNCRSHGGTLALVKSQKITDYLVDKLVYEYGHGGKIWIGLSDRQHEGTFLWEDGSPLDFTNWALHAGPNSNTTSTYEDCVTLMPSAGGLWEDDVCEDSLFGLIERRNPFVCQFKLRGTTPATPT